MATFDRLHVSMTAVSSDWYSGFSGKPEVSITRVFRPGTVERPFARLRSASSTVWTPKSASELFKDGPRDGAPKDAKITGACAFGETDDPFKPATTCFKRCASAVKFCEMCTVPPNSAM